MIYMLRTESEPITPTDPIITGGNEDSVFCYGQVSVRVLTNIPVLVNITASFETGGSWLDASFLTGINKITAPLIDSVITNTTFYNFGINGSDSGFGANTSTITITIKDVVTDTLLDTLIYSRNHAETPC